MAGTTISEQLGGLQKSSPPGAVLIFSALQDCHAQAVMGELARRGTAAELLDLSEFPTQLSLSLCFGASNRSFSIERRGGGRIDLDKVRSVWWRRPQSFMLDTEIKDSAARNLALSEAGTAFQGLYQSLDVFWVNHPVQDAAAAHKPWQLKIAQDVGLSIPPTLMTNDPRRAKEFWRSHESGVIYKQFLALPAAWRETRRLRQEEERLAESITFAPVIFQRYVEGVADLRVIAIGPDLFAAATDIRKAEYPADVRMNLGARYERHELPDEVQQKILALMERMGLVYGAIDLRLTTEGEYVFFEINPAGQFLYIEQQSGLKITAALADLLAESRHGRE